MQRRQHLLGLAEIRRDLDEAAGVGARVGLRAGGGDVRSFALAELRGGRRLSEVVDPGAAAADRLLRRLEQLEAGDRTENRARRVSDALRVAEMAGVLVGDLER